MESCHEFHKKSQELDPNKKILFICHESSRTGAPIALLYFLRWIKTNTSQKFIILIEKGGDIEDYFREVGSTFVIRPRGFTLHQKIMSKIHYTCYGNSRLKKLYNEPVGLIYLNTFSNGRLAGEMKARFNCPLITHVHELESVIRATGRKNIKLLEDLTDHYIAASGAVMENLMLNHSVPESKISVHYEAIEPVPQKVEERNDDPLNRIFVVGGAGFVDYRKGFDLFLETARLLVGEMECRRIRFVWVGGFGRHKREEAEKFITYHGLQDYVEFKGEMADPFPEYRRFNLFFLSSREDPFPLVMLENAGMGIPVIGFRDSGGVEEFLDHDPELLAGHADIHGAAFLILKFMKDRSRAERTGNKLKKKVLNKYLINRVGEAYLDRILQVSGLRAGGGNEGTENDHEMPEYGRGNMDQDP
jgi:glycosyltransferase involved in cell wall biosynthesis